MANYNSMAAFIDSGGETEEQDNQEDVIDTTPVTITDNAASFIEDFGEESPSVIEEIEDTSVGTGIDPKVIDEEYDDVAPVKPADVDNLEATSTLAERNKYYTDRMLPSLIDDEKLPLTEDAKAARDAMIPALEDGPEIQQTFSVNDLTEEDLEGIRIGIEKSIGEEAKSIGGLDPISRSLMTWATGNTSRTYKLLWLGETLENIGEWTKDSLASVLSETQKDEYGSYVYDAVNKLVAGGRYAESRDPEELASRIMGVAGSAGEFAETLPVLGNFWRAGEIAVENRAITKGIKAADKRERNLQKAERNSPERAAFATLENIEEARLNAEKIANENQDIAQSLIKEFEEKTGKVVSVEREGKLVLDPELARKAGKEVMQEVSDDTVSGIFKQLNVPENEALQPILKPEKFNGIVAIASDFKKKFPEAWDEKKTVIDNLFHLTVSKDIDGQSLVDDLVKVGLSFEDYVLTVVGSGSQAGKILNQLSQIKRARPKGDAAAAAERKLMEQQGSIRKGIMRFENARRGLLVSQLATAARNLTSASIRAPMEALGAVMDTALLKLSQDGVGAAAEALVSGQNWRDSFRPLKYMFSRPDMAKGFTDLILNRPELAGQYDRMYNSINEIQKLTGRGEGGLLDTLMSRLEDGVDVLNIPNRWQEYIVRRGQFIGELERQVRNEYGADLIDLLQKGKLRDLLNDASTVKPEGKASFFELVDRSVNSALDITFAKQPDIDFFKETSQWIVKNGATAIMPFPRFMFNSMELMGQYGGGAFIPLARKIAATVSGGKLADGGPLTAKDRQRISRNLIGWSAVGAAYMYRTSEDAPAEYNQISVSDKAQADTTPQWPLAQFLYLGESLKRLKDGTFDDWFDGKEFTKLFTGTNFRTGVGNSILEEVSELANNTDLTFGETTGRLFGRPLGNYLSTWAVPLTQIIDAERITGDRGLEYKDMSQDPTFDFWSTFGSEVRRPFKQRGIGVSAEEEAEAPSREFLYSEGKSRVLPAYKTFLGVTLTTKDEEYGEYLTKKGIVDWKLGSQSKVGSIKRFENAMLREYIPVVVEHAQARENRLRDIYKDKPTEFKSQFTEEEYVNNNIRPFVTGKVRSIKQKIAEGSVAVSSPYTRAMLEYRRITPEYRKLATTDFADRYGRMPDPLDEKDLQKLTIIGKTYRKAYK